MEFNKINKYLILILIIFILFFIYSLIFPVNCKENELCFNDKAANCVRSRFISYNEENKFEYKVLGFQNNNCEIEIKLKEVSPSSSLEIKNSFEGKSMKCLIPKEQLKIAPIQETSNILSYCSGPLKEATLELMIKKLYGVIAQNLGSIINQASNKS